LTVENGVLDPAHEEEEIAPIAGIARKEAGGTKDGDEFHVSEDGNVADHKGVKYVRQAALTEERAERQKLATTLAALDPVMPQFQEFLKQRNNRDQAQVDRARGDSRSDYSADELNGFAITRGYYKADNTTPDTARAGKELDIIAGISNRQAARAVKPVTDSTARESARMNKERAMGAKFVDGENVAQDKYMTAALATLGDDQLADPNVANLVQVVAAGLEYLDHRKNGTLPSSRRGRGGEPMMVERGTGRYDRDNEEEGSALSRAAARARGKTPEQWSKLSKQVNAPRRNSANLETD
jgi:hypothetical protein